MTTQHNNLINGEWRGGQPAIVNRNPSDLDDVVGDYASASAADMRDAVAAARAAFPAWSRSTPQQRAELEKFYRASVDGPLRDADFALWHGLRVSCPDGRRGTTISTSPADRSAADQTRMHPPGTVFRYANNDTLLAIKAIGQWLETTLDESEPD